MAATSDLERYRPLARLGVGGMSTVELAEDTLLGRRVALKRMHTPDDISAHSRLRREALIGASLSHPNLVSIFDILTTADGDDVIVMEYVDGETLAQLLGRSGKPDLATTIRILTGVSAALDAIHAERIVHRDVKPANILLGADGSVKLADLGIAAVPDQTKITTAGSVLGTFSYMAPEQLEGATATPAVDVYALAAVAYEMLSGQRARNEPNPVALAHVISTQPPPDVRSVWPEAPAEAAEVLIRGMSRGPGERPRSAGELTARLRAALEPRTTARVAPPPPAPAAAPASAPRQPPRAIPPPLVRRRSSRGRVLALAGLALALVAALIIVGATSGGGSKPKPQAATSRRHAHSRSSSSSSSSSGSAGAASSSAPASGGGAGAPVAAVESFYHLAASHQYGAAWALADPAFRNQLEGYPSFESSQAGDRSITFNSADVTNETGNSATVYVQTASVRDNGTQHCHGPVNLVRGSSGWLLDHISISCV